MERTTKVFHKNIVLKANKIKAFSNEILIFLQLKNIFKITFVKLKTLCIFASGFGETPNSKYNSDFKDIRQ